MPGLRFKCCGPRSASPHSFTRSDQHLLCCGGFVKVGGKKYDLNGFPQRGYHEAIAGRVWRFFSGTRP